jgi:hypothetical protein
MTRIQYSVAEPSNMPCWMSWRSSRAPMRNNRAKPNWMAAGTRSGRPCSPRARRSAMVRESSCSIGRYITERITNMIAQHSEIRL